MQIKTAPLKPLDSIQLSAEETTILKWLRSASWEAVTGPHDSISYKAKVSEFFGGVRLYRMQAGGGAAGSFGALELLIKKLGLLGIIAKQEIYPLAGHGNQPRYLSLKKADMDNLGIGKEEEEE